jgi:pyruvate-ferredoxin/flavodoxin oxidoreductase
LQAVTNEMEEIMKFIGDVQVSVTEKFFTERYKIDTNSGELFIIAIDTNACSGCGICANDNEGKAFIMEEETPELHSKLNHDFSLWENLPDTSSDTISRLIDDKDYSSFAAILLSRNFNMTTTGGSKTEDEAQVKSLLHLLLSVTEAIVQPKYSDFLKIIDENIEALSVNIKKELGDALPTANFNSLGDLLEKNSSDKISIDEIIASWNGKEQFKILDKDTLLRKVILLRELNELKNAISTGVTGVGRSRYSIALDASLAALAEFPNNNFTSPVVLFDGSTPELVKGLVNGHLRYIIDNLKLIRRAKLEVQNKYNPSIHDAEIANLSWNDLNEDEKAGIPPVLLVTKNTLFRNTGFTSFLELLDNSVPIKVVIVDDCLEPVNDSASHISIMASSMISALSLKKTFILKSSLADPEHLFSGLINGLNHYGTSLFWLFASNPSAHTVINNQKLNLLALNSRAYIHFDYNPDREGELISSKTDINSNPFPDEEWNISQIKYLEDGEEKRLDYKVTWADWAFTINDWKEKFSIYDDSMGSAIPVSDFISIHDNPKTRNIPVIIRVDKSGGLIRYSVPKDVIQVTKKILSSWNMLREVAGTITEYPAKLKQSVGKELAIKYEDEKKLLITDYENKIQNLEEEYLERVRLKLKNKLIELSKTGQN